MSGPTSPSRYSKAPHLTEFYPYLINNPNDPHAFSKASPTISHSGAESIANTIGTINTTNTLHSILSKNDIQKTSAIYDEILEASEAYRNSLSKVVETSANLGNALEKLSKLKGADDINDDLMNVSGFFYLISNHEEILSQSIKQHFEAPITKEVNNFNLKISKNDETFKSNFKHLLKELRLKERENLKISQSKSKSLNLYKSKLLQLTSHLDSIETLKQEYYQDSYELVESSNKKILSQLGTVIRAQVEIYENIARKGWSGGGLDELIAQCSDPFNPEEEEHSENDDDDNTNNNENHSDTTIEDNTLGKKNTPSPFSALRNGGTSEFGEALIDSKLQEQNNVKNEGELQTGTGTSSIDVPRLSHQESIRSLTEAYLNDQSTPVTSPTKEELVNPNTTVNLEEDVTETTIDANDVSRAISSLQLEDDNSFSLPIPGSSSKARINGNKEHNLAIEGNDQIENVKDVDDVKSVESKDFEGHKEWRAN